MSNMYCVCGSIFTSGQSSATQTSQASWSLAILTMMKCYFPQTIIAPSNALLIYCDMTTAMNRIGSKAGPCVLSLQVYRYLARASEYSGKGKGSIFVYIATISLNPKQNSFSDQSVVSHQRRFCLCQPEPDVLASKVFWVPVGTQSSSWVHDGSRRYFVGSSWFSQSVLLKDIHKPPPCSQSYADESLSGS